MSARHHRHERGAATTELVIATPLFLMLLMLIVQFALWQHANHVAESAAQEGARAARLDGGTISEGQATAQSFIDQLGRSVITSPQITATQNAQVVRVEVLGTAENVVPFLQLPVKGTSESSREVFTP